jgi:hypothetical protein
MTDRQQLDALLRRVDPVPNPADPPLGTWTSDVALLEIERRSTTVQTEERPIRTEPSRPDTSPRRGLFAAAAAFALVVAVIGVVAALWSGADQSSAFDSAATPLTLEFAELDAGTYRVDTLGTPMSFTVDETWWVQPNGSGMFVLTDADSGGPGDRDLVFLRPTGLSDPTAPTTDAGGAADWPPQDIDGWLENLIEGVAVGDATRTTLGGRNATVFDVTVDPDVVDCEGRLGLADTRVQCVVFAVNQVTELAFRPTIAYRVWWVDNGEVPPVLVVAGAGGEGPDWFARAVGVIDTVAFGDPTPHPICDRPWECGYSYDVPAGRATFDIGGGVSVVLDTARFVDQSAGFVEMRLDEGSGSVGIMAPRYTPDGTPLSGVVDVVAALEDVGLEFVEFDPITVHGISTRVLDMTEGGTFSSRPALKESPDDTGWSPPSTARIWLLEDDRGVVMITAEASGLNADLDLPGAIEFAESIVATFEFTDQG